MDVDRPADAWVGICQPWLRILVAHPPPPDRLHAVFHHARWPLYRIRPVRLDLCVEYDPGRRRRDPPRGRANTWQAALVSRRKGVGSSVAPRRRDHLDRVELFLFALRNGGLSAHDSRGPPKMAAQDLNSLGRAEKSFPSRPAN